MQTKKRTFHFIMLIVMGSIALFSCRSSEELIFIADAYDNEVLSAANDTFPKYKVKPGDILYISIKTMNENVNAIFNPESNMTESSSNATLRFGTPQGAYLYGYEINEKGMLDLPVMGLIPVAGYTQQEAEAIVMEKTKLFLKDAIVKVKLLNFKITVLGEVRSPGVYYNYNNNFTILEALAMANGNTDFANIKKITLVRTLPGETKTIKMDLSSKDIWNSEAFLLFPNDYIFVEPDKYKNFNLNSQAYSLFFSSLGMLLAILSFVL